jgi:hypothetical protein
MIEEQGINGEHNRQILHFLKEAITKLDTVIHEINDVAVRLTHRYYLQHPEQDGYSLVVLLLNSNCMAFINDNLGFVVVDQIL